VADVAGVIDHPTFVQRPQHQADSPQPLIARRARRRARPPHKDATRMPFKKLADLHPLAKFAVWTAMIAAAAAIVQTAAWILGLEFQILRNGGGGRGVLLGIALASLFLMLAADRRSIADYGLAVGPEWKQRWFGGIAIGVVTYSAYLVLAVSSGALTWHTDSVSVSRSSKALLSAMTSLPLAITQQIVFSGYVLSILRDRCRRATAITLSAALFAALNLLERPETILQSQSWPLLGGLFLVASLLGILRLQTGSILAPAGLLAGWLFVRRLTRKLDLLHPNLDSPLYDWLAPANDPRQAPLMGLLLLAGIVITWRKLQRLGENRLPDRLDTDFKRHFPLSNVLVLAPLDVWLRQLAAARFRIGLRYVPRVIASLVISTVNTVLSLPERLLWPLLLRGRHVPDPVFIVGTHRSGTTHLHNLLALDPRFCAPRNYQTMNPVGFLISGWLITPLLGLFMPWKRAMDGVRFHLFTTQEEEFALAAAGPLSPHWGMTFPRCWPHLERYIFPERMHPRELRAWQHQLRLFLQKLTLVARRRPLLKNPYNTARVALLRSMFPKAKFIHICRHPYTVYRSNMHLASQAHVLNQVHDPDPATSYQARFLENYRAMEEAFERQASELPDRDVARLRFEDLECDPLPTIRAVYEQLGLELSPEFQRRLERELANLADYQKNRYAQLPVDEQQMIDARMGRFLKHWGYAEPSGRQRPPAQAA
jgi:hypothetical protein